MPKIPPSASCTRPDARVIAYVDGLNLHHGLVARGLKSQLWIDPSALVRALLRPGQRLECVNFFTSRLSGARAADSPSIRPTRDHDRRCQTTYLEALVTRERVKLHYGHFLEKVRRCRNCGTSWVIAEEKKTDVLIACHLHICDSKVRRSQLPRVVITPGGMRLERPLEWH